ncbi:MAG: peptide chain release factor N(5)-glutamine methyltransferase [Candidatus Omnitrophica bacterium]|nr:peptide chain release factor N(5)-glutamine methyltransferase [Candidatus Omnitrophota bacterium]
MNRREALTEARKILVENQIEDAALEGEILLRHILGINRSQLYTYLDSDIKPADVKHLLKLVERRTKGEPSAYITGHKEFYGLDFIVNQHVLIPRPETELLVEQAISLCREYRYSTIADIGTGCGAIAISLAVSIPNIKIYAIDISNDALKVAKQNSKKHDVLDKITLFHGDLLQPLLEPVDIIVANLPYVRDRDMPDKGPLSFEPSLALNGGVKGLDKIKTLCRQTVDKLNKKGSLLLEIGQGQERNVTAILREHFPSGLIETKKDLSGIGRVIILRLT